MTTVAFDRNIRAVDWLAKRAQLSPDSVALVDAETGTELSYAAWNRRANRAANALLNLGLEQGDRVAILAANRLEYLDLLFACQKAGLVLQALNWRLTATELTSLVEDATPKILVYGTEFTDTSHKLCKSIDKAVALDTPAADDHHHWQQLSEAAADTPPASVELTADAPWVLCYTGGTTGSPKAATLTHSTVTWNSINTVMSWGLTADDTAILNAPLFHTGGLNVFTTPLVHVGGRSIVCRGFDAEQVFDLVESGQVTLFFGVPTMFIMLQQHERWADADFSKCRLVISGGAPCPQPVFERFFEKGVAFKTGYGLTEAGPNNFWLPDADVREKAGSVGAPLFHVDTRIVYEDGTPCKAGEVGELLIRGPHVTAGYWNDAAATHETIVDGWLHTGDLARRDADGYTYIVGRSKDVIISGGENIYPAEVESVLLGHSAVAEVAVIPIPHPTWGEVGRAIVVPAANDASADDLLDYARERLAGYKVPKSVVFVDELPQTGAGKVDKQALEERYGGDV